MIGWLIDWLMDLIDWLIDLIDRLIDLIGWWIDLIGWWIQWVMDIGWSMDLTGRLIDWLLVRGVVFFFHVQDIHSKQEEYGEALLIAKRVVQAHEARLGPVRKGKSFPFIFLIVFALLFSLPHSYSFLYSSRSSDHPGHIASRLFSTLPSTVRALRLALLSREGFDLFFPRRFASNCAYPR